MSRQKRTFDNKMPYIRYCHMVYYTNVLEAIFDGFEKFRQIDGKLPALTFFPREFRGALKMHTFFLRDES